MGQSEDPLCSFCFGRHLLLLYQQDASYPPSVHLARRVEIQESVADVAAVLCLGDFGVVVECAAECLDRERAAF